MTKQQQTRITRRGFIATGTTVAMLVPGGRALADVESAEKANEELVKKVCKEISTLDMDKLAPYFADDLEFQLIDGQPLIKGKETFFNFFANFIKPYERAEFVVHRSHAIGNLVINERTDHFIAKEGGQDQSFHVAGFCWVKDGKISEWKDYTLPE